MRTDTLYTLVVVQDQQQGLQIKMWVEGGGAQGSRGGGIAGQSMPEPQITGGDARNSKVKTQLPTCSSTWEMT